MNHSRNLALTALPLILVTTPDYSHAAAKKAAPADTEAAAPAEGDVAAPVPDNADGSEPAPADEAVGEPADSSTGQNATEKSVPAVDAGASNAHSKGANEAGGGHHMPELDWPFNGPFGTYDKAALQRGFQVYRQVCASCHAVEKLYYRNLSGIGYSEGQIKTIAAEYTALDGPNDEGEMFERPARPSDHIKRPFVNDQQAMYANGGALPPDLSLITKARHGGADYVYGILTGYAPAPEGVTLTPSQHYNTVKDGGLIGPDGKHIPGGILAMAPPLSEGMVAYEDGSPQTVEQYSRDVAQFLTWAAEPELEARKQMGAKVLIFLAIFALVVYACKRKVWEKIH